MTEVFKPKGNRSVVVGRDVINSIINTGDHNQFFIGDYESLRDAYIEPWSVFERVNLDNFVGREWLLAKVDNVLNNNDCGYIILEAEAGLGKTTILAWFARERGYIHHFTELAPGADGVVKGLRNLAAQLILAYNLNPYQAGGVLPTAAARPDYLSKLLRQASEQRKNNEKIVIVVDALDEAGTPPGQNVMGLPRALPDGIFIIVSQRPVPIALQVDTAVTARVVLHLAADSDDNLLDMRRYIEHITKWPNTRRILAESGYTTRQFVETLLEKCHGVWIYLHYVAYEIEQGGRSPLDLGTLPNGMTQYYARYWQNWRYIDEDNWYGIYLPLLATLAATQEAVAIEHLIEWTKIAIHRRKLLRLLEETWRPFLTIIKREQRTLCRFYHATLREFFTGQIDREHLTMAEQALADELAEATQSAHQHLVERYFSAWGGLEMGLPGLMKTEIQNLDDGYGLRHLPVHLEIAGRGEDLHQLMSLESGNKLMWYSVKLNHGDIASYLADVGRAWRLAEQQYLSSESELAGHYIGLQTCYALMIASINSLANNIPPTLLKELVETHVWTPTQGLTYARQIPNHEQRAEMLAELAPFLSDSLKNKVLQEALAAVKDIEDGYWRAGALTVLTPRLPPALIAEALTTAQSITDIYSGKNVHDNGIDSLPERPTDNDLLRAVMETKLIESEADKIEALARLIPSLSKELLQEALTIVQAIHSEYQRTRASAKLAPRLVEVGLRREAELLAQEIKITYRNRHAVALERLLPGVFERKTNGGFQEYFEIARAIENPYWRAEALAKLASHLPILERTDVLQEALVAAQTLGDVRQREGVLNDLALRLAEGNSPGEALATARMISDGHWQAKALASLAPFLPEPLLPKVLDIVRTIADERRRANTLVALARYIHEPLQSKALEVARSIANAYWRPQAITGLYPYMSDSLRNETLKEILTNVENLKKNPQRVEVLAKLLHHLSGSLQRDVLDQALSIAEAIEEEAQQVEARITLAPFLSKSSLEAMMSVSNTITDEDVRSQMLTTLAACLAQRGYPKESLTTAQSIPDEYWRAEALKRLSLDLVRLNSYQEALMATQAIPYSHWQANRLANLTQYSPTSDLPIELDLARKIRDARWRAVALAKLSSHLPEQLKDNTLSEALTIAKGILAAEEQAATLADIAPFLHKPLIQEAITIAQQIDAENCRTIAVTGIIPYYVREGYVDEALAIAATVADEYLRAIALVRALPYFSDSLKASTSREIAAIIHNITEKNNRIEVLIELVPQLDRSLRAVIYPIWRDALYALATKSRMEFLTGLQGLLPVLEYLGGNEGITYTVNAIQDVGRWWP